MIKKRERGAKSHQKGGSKMQCVRIPAALHEELTKLARDADCSLSAVIVHSLREFIKQR